MTQGYAAPGGEHCAAWPCTCSPPFDLAELFYYPIYDLAAAKRAGTDERALVDAGIWTGPYRPSDVSAQKIIAQRFAGWWGGRAALPGVDLLCIPDAQARLLAVQSGEADIALSPPSAARRALRVTVVYSPRTAPDHEALVVALQSQLKPLGIDVV